MEKVKKSILAVLFAILFLPMLQKAFPFIQSGPLNGEFTIAPDVALTLGNWFSDSFATQKTRYLNDNIGFRPDLIRLNNEVDFSLFKKIHSEWRLLGDNACIFQDVYIYSYLGRDYDGYACIAEKARKLKAIQDTLQKLGKIMVFIHAPDKAFYYPEYIPAAYKNAPRHITNFETYKRVNDSLGINQLDFNTWFCAMKNTSKELLYAKQSFHWTIYGGLLGADSLVKYIDRTRHITMPYPTWASIAHTTKARYTDDDIAKTMNLVLPLANETFSYPDVTYEGDKTTTKPNIIYIGDSFFFQWMDEGVIANISNNWQLWYYNRLLLNNDYSLAKQHSLGGCDKPAEIAKADCIVFMYTSRNLTRLGNGIIEQLYDHYYPNQ